MAQSDSAVAQGKTAPNGLAGTTDSSRVGPSGGKHRYVLLILAVPFCLLLLTVVFCWQIALTGRILVEYDLFTYFYPMMAYAKEISSPNGIPLWNPYLFLGVPFMANIQTALFYPFNIALRFLEPPIAVNVSILLHTFLAGLFMFLFALYAVRANVVGAFASALVFMFSGFLSAQAGHINQFIASAWLPLILLCYGLAYQRRSLAWTVAGAIVVAIQLFAGHTQEVYLTMATLVIYAFFLLAAAIKQEIQTGQSNHRPGDAATSSRRFGKGRNPDLTLGPFHIREGEARHSGGDYRNSGEEWNSGALRQGAPVDSPGGKSEQAIGNLGVGAGEKNSDDSNRSDGVRHSNLRRLSRHIVCEALLAGLFLALMVGLGAALSAPQILPTLELSRLSIRGGGMTAQEASSFSLAPWDLPRAILPGFIDNPFSEYTGYIGFLPLGLGLLALVRGRKNHYTWLGIVLIAVAIFFALGGYNPWYGKVLRMVPGLRLFRVPARWLFVVTFGASILTAIGLSCLNQPPDRLQRAKNIASRAIKIYGLAVAVILGLALLAHFFLPMPHPEVLWIWTPLALATAGVILTATRYAPHRFLNLAIIFGIIMELFAARQNLNISKPVLAEAYSSMRPTVAQLLADHSLFRILSIAASSYDPGDLPELRAILRDQMPRQQIDDFAVSTKYKEILTPNLPLRYGLATIDGYDGGVLPLKRYVEFKSVLALTAARNSPERTAKPMEPDGILREDLPAIPDADLLSDLNVKYVLADKLQDPWVDNIYYDLAFTRWLQPGQTLSLDHLPSFATSVVGVVSFLSGAADLPDGTPVAEVTVVDARGEQVQAMLRAGKDTAEGLYQRPNVAVQHQVARVVSTWRGDQAGHDYHTTIDLSGVRQPRQITIRSLLDHGQFALRGLSLIDARTAASESITIDPAFRLVLSGDVKVYENLKNKPRAYLTNDYIWAPDDQSAINLLSEPNRPSLVLTPNEGVSDEMDWWARLWRSRMEQSPGQAQTTTLPNTTTRSPGTAEILEYAPERVRLRVNASETAFLVLSDTLYPGWQAAVDGQEVSILRANYLLRAVQVPAGEHEVVFEYQPLSLIVGWHVAEIAIAVALLLLVLEVVRRWHHSCPR